VSPRGESVVEVSEYLRETLHELDDAITDMQQRRHALAFRQAVLDAANDPELQRVADEVQQLLDRGERLPDVRTASDVLAEAHRRFVR
jgi:hypothetical protein